MVGGVGCSQAACVLRTVVFPVRDMYGSAVQYSTVLTASKCILKVKLSVVGVRRGRGRGRGYLKNSEGPNLEARTLKPEA